MTADFIPDSDFESTPTYPTAFGITFTPMISGVVLGVMGLLGAGAIVSYLVMPAWEANQALDAKVKEKTQQLQQQGEIRKQIQEAKNQLEQAKQKRDQVYSLFASEKTLNTLLFDLNQLIERNNAGLLAARNTKLNACPVYVQQLFSTPGGAQEFQDRFGQLVAEAKLRRFKPDEKGAAVISDSSLGAPIDNKLKRQTIDVEIRGNFNQTQSIFRTIERLQPLLLVRNLSVKVADNKVSEGLYEIQPDGTIRYLTNCQPDNQITTTFQMDALMPLTEVERKAAQAAAQPPKP
ncbi:pilus assembly protein PilO [Cyanobacteria bacterium FACHB-DQ100]|uniref:pilus assembly protein PilO n=1 Tax=Leptolyngbya sp. DQ-M1 TaxID=2933920 RepID=UPI0019872AD1|nr:pilus assembly protein PilO [Cyanobacteria bacterium FACHB-DQ100]